MKEEQKEKQKEEEKEKEKEWERDIKEAQDRLDTLQKDTNAVRWICHSIVQTRALAALGMEPDPGHVAFGEDDINTICIGSQQNSENLRKIFPKQKIAQYRTDQLYKVIVVFRTLASLTNETANILRVFRIHLLNLISPELLF